MDDEERDESANKRPIIVDQYLLNGRDSTIQDDGYDAWTKEFIDKVLLQFTQRIIENLVYLFTFPRVKHV